LAHKNITISEEAYNILADNKRTGESFTEVIIRLLGSRKRGSLLEHKGRWVGSDDEFELIYKEIDALNTEGNVRVARQRSA